MILKIYDKALTAREVALLAGLTEQELLDADVDAINDSDQSNFGFRLIFRRCEWFCDYVGIGQRGNKA